VKWGVLSISGKNKINFGMAMILPFFINIGRAKL
jgi:hypothetical protein